MSVLLHYRLIFDPLFISKLHFSQLTKPTVSLSVYAKRVINVVQQAKIALLMITLWLIRMKTPETLKRRAVTAGVVPSKIWQQKQH